MAYSWTYGGIRAETLFLQTTHVRRDILPPVNARTVPVPGRAGDQFVQADYEMRTITIDVFIDSTSMVLSETYVRDIAEFLDVTDGLKALVFDDNPNLEYQAVVSGNTDISQILELKRGQITFLIPDVYANAAAYISIPFYPMEFSRNSAAVTLHGGSHDSADFLIEDFDQGGHNPTYSILTDTNIEDIDGHVPRYLYDTFYVLPLPDTRIKGVLVEEGTTNLLLTGAANGILTASYVAVGSVLSSVIGQGAWQSAKYNPQGGGIVVDLNGGVAVEGLYTQHAGAAAATTYTFSACVNWEGIDPPNLYLRVEMYTAGMVLLSTSDSAAFTRATTAIGYQRFTHTFTTVATTANLRLYVITKEAHTANAVFSTSAWQLEQKAYPTSWHYGSGSPDGNVRSPETMVCRTANMINGTDGTIQLIFSPSATRPNSFGAVLDWGEFDAGNAKDRIAVLHGTSVGTSRRTFQLQVTNGATTATNFISLVLTTASSEGQKYYVAVRWHLTGNIGTGYVKLNIVDIRTGQHLTTTTATATTPISFANYPKMNIGHNHGGANWQNAVFHDIRFDTAPLSDSAIAAIIATLNLTDNNPFQITAANQYRYRFNRDQLPILYLPTGNVNTQKGYFTFGNASVVGDLEIDDITSGRYLLANDFGWVTRFNFENNTYLYGFSTPANMTLHMEDLSFQSIFWPLLLKQEMELFVTSDNKVSLQAFRKIIGTTSDPGLFEYRPRYL